MQDVVHIGSVFRERYEIQGALGEGGFGTVYKARQLATGQSVAIKVLRLPAGDSAPATEKRIARFQREMQICAQMHHPNIVSLIDSGQAEGGIVYSVFEFLPGKNLAELLAEEGRLDPGEARHFMTQILDALGCAHGAGVVHRDLKPANIMIVSTGVRRNALVLDFGIGALTEEARRDEGARITLTNESIGTPSYAAPEQLRGHPPTPRSDLYAWGLVFLECLSGKRVVEGETVAEVVWKQLSPEPVPIPEAIADHPLGRILRRVTAKDPAARDASVEALLRELEGCDLSGLRPRTGPVRIDPAPADAATATVQLSTTDPGGRGPRLVEGERRQITAVCCNLGAVGTGPRPADVEELDHVLGVQQEACAAVARRLDGHVAGALGDAVLFYFGYPTAREDDARRAARAALAMATEVRRRSAELTSERAIRVDVRVGIHTGLVVSRELGGPEPSRIGFVVGTTPKLAARLAGLAEPGSVVVSGSTQRLLRKDFVLDASGLRVVDDSTLPVELFVLRAGDPSAGSRDLPLVGRERELTTLSERWAEARAGAGQAVLVSGEPGIGKSRLCRELAERIGDEPHTWLECRAAPDGAGSAFYPIIELLDRMLDPRHETKPEGKVSKLEVMLSLYGFELSDAMPLFAPLLSLSLPARWAPLDVSPQKKRELTRNAVLSLLFEMAEKEPVVLVVEDLHWADPSTIELLGQLVAEVGSARVLAVFTARPELTPPWPSTSVLPVQLGRFGRPEVVAMAAKITGGRALPAEVLDAVAGRTDGVPLFVEELLLTMIESGALVERDGGYALAKPLSEVAIPATLRDSLVARLDRLGRAKETAQVASAIGREFTFELLRAVSPLEEAAAQEDLDRLVAAELVFRRRQRKNPAYIFKHALVRDAAYESMLKRSRREVHGRIAKALEEGFPQVVAERADLLAHHHASADHYREAVTYAGKGAGLALARSASAEAAAHATQGLAWLALLDESPERAESELSLNNLLCPALVSTHGWATPRIKETAERSLALLDSLGDGPHRAASLWALLTYHHVRGREPARALSLAERLLAVSAQGGDAGQQSAAHTAVASCLLAAGDYRKAQEHLESALALYDPVRHRDHAYVYGQDSRVLAGTSYVGVLSALGYPDRALALAQSTLAWAREINHPGTTATALLAVVSIFYLRREPAAVAPYFEELIALADRYGLPAHLAFAGVLGGWAAGDADGALAHFTTIEASGSELGLGMYGGIVAEVDLAAGRTAAALDRIRRSLAHAEEVRALGSLSNLYRISGVIELAHDPAATALAEDHLRRALATAREQGAKLPELEAAIALYRLLRGGDRRGEGRALLREAHAALTEGFETPQLREARALLDEPEPGLGSSRPPDPGGT